MDDWDQTMVLYGSNLGDANIHDTTNLPILLEPGDSVMASILPLIVKRTTLFVICS